MSEDGEKDQEKDEQAPSRPDSARRKRRSSDRAADDTDAKQTDGKAADDKTAKASRGGDRGKGAAPRGKNTPSDRGGGDKPAGKNQPTPKRDAKAREQESLFARARRFLREVWAELKKVVWPTRKQMVTYTSVVLVFLAFMIALVFGLDFVFGEAISVVFGE